MPTVKNEILTIKIDLNDLKRTSIFFNEVQLSHVTSLDLHIDTNDFKSSQVTVNFYDKESIKK
jgi:hypothetical protein